ncbi:MAG: endonuclease/exonuclease/phosphatase family protein [bacterium]
MAKAFSIVSWNVEHFKDDPSRVNRVVDFLNHKNGGNKPDIFALYEVEAADVYTALVNKMPGYTFHITEGVQYQEILIGVKSNITAFFTQKDEFKTGNTYLRPGALLAVNMDNINYAILFLHTKSLTDAAGFGIRDEMLHRATKFRKKLEKAMNVPEWSSKYLFTGDLNTMGLEYPYNKDIEAELELKRLKGRAGFYKMNILTKNQPYTFFNGSGSNIPKSNLDHVVASSNMKFKQFNGCDVSVRGWVDQATDAQKDNWIKNYSDHSLLYMEVQK